jgi:hypothetical protein
MAEFVELEEIDGVRMSWNVWPYSRLEVGSPWPRCRPITVPSRSTYCICMQAAKCVIPFGVLYTPAKQTSQLQVGILFLVIWGCSRLPQQRPTHQLQQEAVWGRSGKSTSMLLQAGECLGERAPPRLPSRLTQAHAVLSSASEGYLHY